MNGLPAFHAINEHLVGNAAGNTNHRDLYTATYGALNKDAADWLMYGAASNVLGLFHPDLKINLYGRGDINPRNATILPTSPSEIPIISASTKFFGNLKETMGKLNDGGAAWTTVLQGLEHNGVNRPLAGLAVALEGFGNPAGRSFSTTNSGSISASNDILSLVNAGRILGGKPLDEALAIDAGFRNSVYQAKDSARRKALGEAIKTVVIAGNHPSEDQMHSFLNSYVKVGGHQENFVKYMMDINKSANTSQANIIAKHLKTPYARNMQELLGGAAIKDFSNSPVAAAAGDNTETNTETN
jgi:hypothetical protein